MSEPKWMQPVFMLKDKDWQRVLARDEVQAQRAREREEFAAQWESTVPTSWLDPATAEHGVIVRSQFRALGHGCGSTRPFLRWFMTHQREAAAIRELVLEAEVRYCALLKVLHERTTPRNIEPSRVSPMFTAWHTLFPPQSALKVCWQSCSNSLVLDSAYQGPYTMQRVFAEKGAGGFVRYPVRPEDVVPLPTYGWDLTEGTSEEWSEKAMYPWSVGSAGYKPKALTKPFAELFPGEPFADPYEPLVEVTRRFGVLVVKLDPLSLTGTFTKNGKRFYRGALGKFPSLVRLYLHPSQYRETARK